MPDPIGSSPIVPQEAAGFAPHIDKARVAPANSEVAHVQAVGIPARLLGGELDHSLPAAQVLPRTPFDHRGSLPSSPHVSAASTAPIDQHSPSVKTEPVSGVTNFADGTLDDVDALLAELENDNAIALSENVEGSGEHEVHNSPEAVRNAIAQGRPIVFLSPSRGRVHIGPPPKGDPANFRINWSNVPEDRRDRYMAIANNIDHSKIIMIKGDLISHFSRGLEKMALKANQDQIKPGSKETTKTEPLTLHKLVLKKTEDEDTGIKSETKILGFTPDGFDLLLEGMRSFSRHLANSREHALEEKYQQRKYETKITRIVENDKQDFRLGNR